MHRKTILLVCVMLLLMGGCIGHYRYESKGNVATSSSGNTQALLYWYGDDGRLWYGRRYQAVDSGVEMKVCKGTPKQFAPLGNENVTLQLSSRARDHRVAEVDSSGNVVNLPDPEILKAGNFCGQISISGQAASTEDLSVGAKPEVIILCESQRNPDRYPAVGRYEFKAVTMTKVDGNEPPESVCPAP